MTTKAQSKLRYEASQREFRQRCINTIVDLKISYGRLIALLSRNSNKLPDTDHHPISPWDPNKKQWSELETLLLYSLPDDQIPATITPLPATPLPQLPITGDIMKITQEEQHINLSTKPENNGLSLPILPVIEETIASHVITFKRAHNGAMPEYISMNSLAQTTLEIRGYAKGGRILNTKNGEPSKIQICIDEHLHADQVICN